MPGSACSGIIFPAREAGGVLGCLYLCSPVYEMNTRNSTSHGCYEDEINNTCERRHVIKPFKQIHQQHGSEFRGSNSKSCHLLIVCSLPDSVICSELQPPNMHCCLYFTDEETEGQRG